MAGSCEWAQMRPNFCDLRDQHSSEEQKLHETASVLPLSDKCVLPSFSQYFEAAWRLFKKPVRGFGREVQRPQVGHHLN